MTLKTLIAEYIVDVPEGATHYTGGLYTLPTFYKLVPTYDLRDRSGNLYVWERLRDKWYPFNEEEHDRPGLKLLVFKKK